MSSPQRLRFTSPSPVEEDISRAQPYQEDTALDPRKSADSSKRKQKQRQQQGESSYTNSWPEEPTDEPFDPTEIDTPTDERYPPMNDEAADARKVEETLRQWEKAERQRRKAARESTASSATTSSLVGEVARKAGSLWPSKRAKQLSGGGLGAHHVLQTTDDGMLLDDITPSPGVSRPSSPHASENPFNTPTASRTSLNPPNAPAIMTESSGTMHDPADADIADPALKRSVLEASSSYSKSHPPPAPLDLPKPRSPPPRTATPHTSRPPEPIPPPAPASRDPEEEPPPTLWWTDWLCGCREGTESDRQAGRTNPFE